MTRTPGEDPGFSSSGAEPLPAYSRPWRALVVAAIGFVATLLLLAVYPSIRVQLRGLPGWASAAVDLIVLSLPLVLAVIVAGLIASRIGVARATGIRSWRLFDLLYGLGVGLIVRAIVEVVAPTTGSLGGPFGAPPLAQTVVTVVGIVLISPFVEEWFFRGLVVRALVDALAGAGRVLASVVAIVVSAAAFSALHFVPYGASVPVSLLIGTLGVGLGCGVLTVLTGRLGGAIAAHITFNVIGVVLLLI